MTLGLPLYRIFTRILALFSGWIFTNRVRAGKEDGARLNERYARDMPGRPSGRLVWLHGASVGESLLLLEVARKLKDAAPDVTCLFTSQTQTSARLVTAQMPNGAIHQIAPLDAPGYAKRFIAHWQPELAIFAEGEIWPNLIREADRSGAAMALINARMTDKSLKGWNRWRCTSQKVFGAFDVILAADPRTAEGLTKLAGRAVTSPGNLKTALPPPAADSGELARLERDVIAGRSCLLAASTHQSEEALVLDAWEQMNPRPILIIAPRHPERGEEIAKLIKQRGHMCAQRSLGDPLSADTRILLADTLGEMGLWYRLSSITYLGGGHAPGVGGHNPLEPLKLGVPVITGPDVFNFASMIEVLTNIGAVRIANDASDLARLASADSGLSKTALTDWLAEANAPMHATLAALTPLLEPRI